MLILNKIGFSRDIFTKSPNNNNVIQGKKYANLAPLAYDTVSFGASKTLNKPLLEAFDNIEICREISENANIVERDLMKILGKNLAVFVQSKNNPNGLIYDIETRVKSADSIREKIASELSWAIINDLSNVFHPNSTDDIKRVCKDVVGARIILSDSDPKSTSKIIDALINAVDNGEIKITGIQNYECVGDNQELLSFTKEDIKRLEEAVNKKTPNKKLIKSQTRTKSAGYVALHLDIDLSNPEYKAKNNNYLGELQIIGYDVAKLKDVEDFCYKIKDGKTIKGDNIAYKPFIEYFKNHIKNSQYENLQADFDEYTKRAYIEQRKKPALDMNDTKRKKDYTLPSISECNMEGKVPPELDFNVLQKLKYHCDRIYKITEGN